MKKNFITATVVGLGMTGAIVGGLYVANERLRDYDIENCERVPQYCPYKEIKTSGVTQMADYDQIGMQILFDQIERRDVPTRAGP
jgi:hypothetical protein